ncbi:MAG: hypothetical protein ACKO7N_05810 [Candidatus Nitrosotenuis sp.]
MYKICSCCKISKTLDQFANAKKASDGKQWNCKECKQKYKKKYQEHIKEQSKTYRKKNKEKITENSKIYRQQNLEKIQERNRSYRIKNKSIIAQKKKERIAKNPEKAREQRKLTRQKNIDKILAQNKEYRIKNQEKIKEYRQKPEVMSRRRANRLKNKDKINANKRYQEKLKRNTDPSYKLITNQRTRITGILKKHKTDKTLDLLGCSAQFLRKYIEQKFQDGMNWNNYGKYGWHIDHIKPCSSFDLTDTEQQKLCFHYTNLQPLWAEENLRKSNKIYA